MLEDQEPLDWRDYNSQHPSAFLSVFLRRGQKRTADIFQCLNTTELRSGPGYVLVQSLFPSEGGNRLSAGVARQQSSSSSCVKQKRFRNRAARETLIPRKNTEVKDDAEQVSVFWFWSGQLHTQTFRRRSFLERHAWLQQAAKASLTQQMATRRASK